MIDATERLDEPTAGNKRVCIVGASGKLGRYMIQHALERNYEVVGVCPSARPRALPLQLREISQND